VFVKTSLRDWRRALDFSSISPAKANPKTSMQNAIVAYVRGIRGSRQNGVSIRQVEKWFFATPKPFVGAAIDELLYSGRLSLVGNSLVIVRTEE
jgi:hypothetical protein